MDLMSPYQRMNLMNVTPMDEVKKWVLETCGSNLEEATGSMKIKGIPNEIAQFVVHKPIMKLQIAFKDRKKMNRYGSSLMFHGTPLPNLQSILQGGFKGGRTGAVWVAKEPLTSIGYALKAAMLGFLREGGARAGAVGDLGRKGLVKQFGNIMESPYTSYGALLGCEYVEKEQYGGRGGLGSARLGAPPLMLGRTFETTFTNDPRAVMVRYVFLVPPETGSRRGGGNGYFRQMAARGQEPGPVLPLPFRSQIKTQMIENMEHIEARIEGRRLER